jgi:glycosyltransferase involved in cell wall biosynthesis
MAGYCVVITTHERPLLLTRAIRSVKAQHAGRVQIVLVSDIACEATQRVASALLGGDDIFVQRGGRPGPAESRNIGIKLAGADFVIFLDDDDALAPNYLRDAERRATSEAVLYTDFHAILERVEPDGFTPVAGERRSLADRAVEDLWVKNFIPPACLVYPIGALRGRRVEPDLVLNEDWDFILNILADYPFTHVPIDGPLVYTRDVADNRGNRNNHLLEATYRAIYRNRPAPTPALKHARQAFLAANGIGADLADL